MSWLVGGVLDSVASVSSEVSSFAKDVISEGLEDDDESNYERALHAAKRVEEEQWDKISAERDQALEAAESAELQIASISTQYRTLLIEKETEVKKLQSELFDAKAELDQQHAAPAGPADEALHTDSSLGSGGGDDDIDGMLSLQTQLKRVRADLDQTKSESAKWKQQAESQQNGAGDTSGELIRANQELEEKLRAVVDRHQDGLAEMHMMHSEKVSQMELEMHNLRSRCTTLEQCVEDAKAEVEDRDSMLRIARAGITTPAQEGAAADGLPTDWADERAALHQEQVRMQMVIATMAKERTALQLTLDTTIADHTALVTRLHREVKGYKVKIAALEDDASALESTVAMNASLNKRIAQLETEVKAATAAAASSSAADGATSAASQGELAKINQEKAELESEMQRLFGESAISAEEIARLTTQCHALQAQLAESAAENAMLEKVMRVEQLHRAEQGFAEVGVAGADAAAERDATAKAKRLNSVAGVLVDEALHMLAAQLPGPEQLERALRKSQENSAVQQERLKMLDGVAREKDAECQALQQRQSELQAQLGQLQVGAARTEAGCDAAAARVVELERECEALRGAAGAAAKSSAEVDILRSRVDQLQAALDETANAAAATAAQHGESLVKLRADAASEADAASLSAAQSNATISALQTRLNAATAAAARAAEDDQVSQGHFEAEAVALKSELARRVLEASARDEELNAAHAAVQAQTADLDTARVQLADTVAELDAHRVQLVQAQSTTQQANQAAALSQQQLVTLRATMEQSSSVDAALAEAQQQQQQTLAAHSALQAQQQADATAFQADAALFQSQIRALQTELAEGNAQHEAAAAGHAAAEEERRQAAAALQATADGKAAEIESLQSQLGGLRASLQDAAAISTVSASAGLAQQQLEQALAEMQGELQDKVDAIASLQDRVVSSGNKLQETERALQASAADKAVAEGGRADASVKLAVAQDMLAAQKTELESVQAKLAAFAHMPPPAAASVPPSTVASSDPEGADAGVDTAAMAALSAERDRLKSQLSKLQEHLISSADMHEQETMELGQELEKLQLEVASSRENLEGGLEEKLAEMSVLEGRLKVSDTKAARTLKDLERASQELQRLETENSRLTTSLGNLELALEGFQSEKDSTIDAMQQRSNLALVDLQSELFRTKGELTKHTETGEALAAKEGEIGRLKGELNMTAGLCKSLENDMRRLQNDLGVAQGRLAHAVSSASTNTVDKEVVRNMVVSFCEQTGEQRQQALTVLSHYLEFTDAEKYAAGIRQQQGFFSALLSGPALAPTSDRKQSKAPNFAEDLVSFMMEEAAASSAVPQVDALPRTLFPATNPQTPVARASTSSSVGQYTDQGSRRTSSVGDPAAFRVKPFIPPTTPS